MSSRTSKRSARGGRTSKQAKLPSIVDHELGVPWNGPYRHLMFGGYSTKNGGPAEEHAIVHTQGIDQLTESSVVLVRINSACFTGDIFGDGCCDCHWQLVRACEMAEAAAEGHGDQALILYHLHHEGKAQGWIRKLRAYKDGMFSVNGDNRDFRVAVAILHHLRVRRVRLITNNPHKHAILEQYGIEVVETIPIVSEDPRHEQLLHFKRDSLGHAIPKVLRA